MGSDRRLALVLSAILFAIVAWPLAFVRIPPYQDLPGHLAAVTALAHPDAYPELLPTGFAKPNSAFFLVVLLLGRAIGIPAAAKVFVLATLAATALVLPRFILHFGGRRRMILATPLVVPMVHNWFVSMGMLNFAASIPVTLLLLVEIDRRRTTPAALLALFAWYLHPFPVLVVAGLAVIAAVTRAAPARAVLVPLLPAGILAALVFIQHAAVGRTAHNPPVFSALHWALYNLWSQWFYGFTELTAVSLVPAIVLAVCGVRRWREGRGLLAPAPVLALLVAYFAGPYVAFDANYITPRLVPFLWMAALVRLPERLPRWLAGVLGASAIAYGVGMGIDLVRLGRELDAFVAGAEVVPERARLLTLNFNPRPTSKNTFSLGTAWGLYVVERRTSAFDVWAGVPSMPFMRRTPLPPYLDPMSRLRFVVNAASAPRYCGDRRAAGFVIPEDACERMWREEWARFWAATLPELDDVVLWDPPAPVLETIPPQLERAFTRGRLHVYARVSAR